MSFNGVVLFIAFPREVGGVSDGAPNKESLFGMCVLEMVTGQIPYMECKRDQEETAALLNCRFFLFFFSFFSNFFS